MSNAAQALQSFVEQWISHQKNQGITLTTDYDSQWPSTCYQYDVTPTENEICQWLPVKQTANTMFERLSEALEVDIHPDLIAYYSSFYSNSLAAKCSDGELELLQVWNEDDFERLRSNLIGHAMSKKKLRQPLSFFFALALPEEGMLCIDNQNGEIWYELPGQKPVRKVAQDMTSFLKTLSPRNFCIT